MKIDLSINIDENIIEDYYNSLCGDNECETCCCQVLIGEDYDNCIDKYKKLFLIKDIEYKAYQLFR